MPSTKPPAPPTQTAQPQAHLATSATAPKPKQSVVLPTASQHPSVRSSTGTQLNLRGDVSDTTLSDMRRLSQQPGIQRLSQQIFGSTPTPHSDNIPSFRFPPGISQQKISRDFSDIMHSGLTQSDIDLRSDHFFDLEAMEQIQRRKRLHKLHTSTTHQALTINATNWNTPNISQIIARRTTRIDLEQVYDDGSTAMGPVMGYPKSVLIQHLSQLQSGDEIHVSLNANTTSFLLAILPALHDGIIFFIKPNSDIDRIQQFFTASSNKAIIRISALGMDQAKQAKLINILPLLKPGTFLIQHELYIAIYKNDQSAQAESHKRDWFQHIPPHIRLLVPKRHDPVKGVRLFTIQELQTTIRWKLFEASPPTAIVSNQTSDHELHIMHATGTTKPYLLEDIADEQITQLKKYFNRLTAGPNVSPACIARLSAAKLRLSGPLASTNIRTHRAATAPRRQPQRQRRISATASMAALKFMLLKDIPTTTPNSAGHNAIMHKTAICQHGISCDFYSKQHALKDDEATVFILAQVDSDTLLINPTTNIRQIIVLSQQQFDQLDSQRQRLDNIDYLVIKSIQSPHKPSDIHSSSTKVSFYRAALMFAYTQNISHCLVSDGCTDRIHTTAPIQTMAQAYDAMKRNMLTRNLATIGIASANSHQPKINQLANKNIMLNIGLLRKTLSTLEQFLAILPDSTISKGLESYLQNILQHLFRNSDITGIIDPRLLRMATSRKRIHLADEAPRQLQASAEFIAAIKACNPALANAITRVQAIFNANVSQAIQETQDAKQKIAHARLGVRNAHRNQIKSKPLPKLSVAIPFEIRLRQTLQSLLDKRPQIDATPIAADSCTKKPYPHQWQAIETITRSLNAGRNLSTLLNIATGTGKTLIQGVIALAALASGNGTVVLVSPYRHLASQTYDAIIRLIADFPALGETFSIDPNSIYKIFSEDHQAFRANTLASNLQFKRNRRKILIACAPSLKQLLTSDPQLAPAIDTILVDEAHLMHGKKGRTYLPSANDPNLTLGVLSAIAKQHASSSSSSKLATSESFDMAMAIGLAPKVEILCTATPKQPMTRAHKPSAGRTTVTFDRSAAIRAKIITPLRVDHLTASELRTPNTASASSQNAPSTLNLKSIVNLVKYQEHPDLDHQFLKDRKGIIFVHSQAEAAALRQLLVKEIPGLACFQISCNNPDRISHIKQFQGLSSAVAIAVDMLAEGFDDPTVSYTIIAKDTSTRRITQMVGRILRVNHSHAQPNQQVGLAICSDRVKLQSCYPKGFRQLSKTRYRSSQLTLEHLAAQACKARYAAQDAAEATALAAQHSSTAITATTSITKQADNTFSIAALRKELRNEARQAASSAACQSPHETRLTSASADDDSSDSLSPAQPRHPRKRIARRHHRRRRVIESSSPDSDSDEPSTTATTHRTNKRHRKPIESPGTSTDNSLQAARKRADSKPRQHVTHPDSDSELNCMPPLAHSAPHAAAAQAQHQQRHSSAWLQRLFHPPATHGSTVTDPQQASNTTAANKATSSTRSNSLTLD